MPDLSIPTISPAGDDKRGTEGRRASRYSSSRKTGAWVFGTLVFVGACVFIGRTFQWGSISASLLHVRLGWLLIGGGVSILLFWVLRALRWHILLRQLGVRVRFLDLYLCTAASVGLALFTPFQTGEMIKVELLNRYGMLTRFPGYGSFIVERIVDLMVVLSIAGVSLFTILDILPIRAHLYTAVAVCATGFLLMFTVIWKARLKGRIGELFATMRSCTGDVKTMVLVAFVSVLSWVVVGVSWQILLYSASIDLGLAKTMALMSVMALVCIASLVPGGLGINEAGSAQILIHFGCSAPVAQAGALVLRTLSLLTVVLGAAHLVAWRIVRVRRLRRTAGTERDETAGLAR